MKSAPRKVDESPVAPEKAAPPVFEETRETQESANAGSDLLASGVVNGYFFAKESGVKLLAFPFTPFPCQVRSVRW